MQQTVAWPIEVSGCEYSILFDARDTNIAPAVAQDRTWEPWQLAIYERLIGPDWCCLDIGANAGLNTIAMAQFAHVGKVFAFEPVPATCRLLEQNLENNRIDREQVSVIQNALGSDRATKDIAFSHMELGRASLSVLPETDDESELHRETVSVISLDEWWMTHRRPIVNFIKIDVEGYELDVLAGATALLGEHPSLFVMCEMNLDASNDHSDNALALLNRLMELFNHVLFVGREGRLYPLKSYAQLRAYMMQGHQVDDLFCCNVIPSGLNDLLADHWIIPARLSQECEISDCRMVVFSNRYADGWTTAIQNELPRTSCAVALFLHKEQVLTVSLKEIYSKHAGNDAKNARVFVDASVFKFNLLDKAGEVSIRLPSGQHWIFCETDFFLEARKYLGNERDPRRVGANLKLEFARS
jgi:FkbM family methyltransferase